jgi:hypothetical protein
MRGRITAGATVSTKVNGRNTSSFLQGILSNGSIFSNQRADRFRGIVIAVDMKIAITCKAVMKEQPIITNNRRLLLQPIVKETGFIQAVTIISKSGEQPSCSHEHSLSGLAKHASFHA